MTVVARWEWRVFGAAADQLAPSGRKTVESSDELYLVATGSDASVKVRDGLMDVKRLLAVENGLEQWLPVLKAPLPLTASDAAIVFAALGQDLPTAGDYTLDDLVAATRCRIHPVAVRKRRTRFTLDGCMAEQTVVRVNGAATRTAAVESEDPARVLAALRARGLDPRSNTCVARGLKALAGIGGRRFAAIDVGTNSVKFHVGERAADGTWRTLADRAEVTRLGEGLDERGRLGEAAIERTAAAVAGMVDEAERHEVEAIAAVGTAGLRKAPNAAELVARAGVPIEVVSGEEEARLAYLAATTALGPVAGTLVVFDTGGGSSQFSFGRPDAVHERFSVEVGAVRFTERFGLAGVTPLERLEAATARIAAELGRLAARTRPDAVVGMGGAVTNLAAVLHGLAVYDPEVVQGTVLDRAEIERQIELYRACDRAQRERITGLQPARADVILAGACIVRVVLTTLGADSLTVSDRGLRHGLLAERFAVGPPVVAATPSPA